MIVIVVSEYVDFLPAASVPTVVTGLLEPLTMASAMAFSRVAGRPLTVEDEEVVVVVDVGADDEDVDVEVEVAEGDATGGFGGSCVSCRFS